MLNSKTVIRNVVISLLAVALLPGGASACLWDFDTLETENSRFPDTLELITGKFPRHSQDYYRWRIRDRLKRMEQEPGDLALYDDLAVAYDKIGDHNKAIETISKKEELQPGLYETAANLGTFYVHNGQLEEGLKHLKRAVEINPDAHFGREIYQILLVEFVLKNQREGKTVLPISANFAEYVLASRNIPTHLVDVEISDATKGILGMMRFGNYKSPILLEALGDLLSAHPHDAKLLAARAYLKAAIESDHPETSDAYQRLATNTLQTGEEFGQNLTIRELDLQFQQELILAQRWWNEVHLNELRWIYAGENVDQHFSEKFYRSSSPVAHASQSNLSAQSDPSNSIAVEAPLEIVVEKVVLDWPAVSLSFVAGVIVTWIGATIYFVYRQKRSATAPSAAGGTLTSNN